MEQILDQVDSKPEDKYGGFGVRLLAAFLDMLLISVVESVLGYMIFPSGIAVTELHFGWISFGQLLSTLYFAYFESSTKQATPGKQVMGLKVIGLNGERISFLNALGRDLASYLSAFIFFIGYLMIAFDAKKRGLHDRLAGTYVVEK